jgi:excisionase family DNA binding protein
MSAAAGAEVSAPNAVDRPEPLLTAREVADLLGESVETVLRRFRRGDLPGLRLGNGARRPVRFRWSEVEAWCEGGRS